MIRPVCSLSELSVGVPERFEVEGQAICVVRTEERRVKAVADTCSHEDYSLSEGWLYGNAIECVLHGSIFDLDTGVPDAPPATEAIAVYECMVDDDTVSLVLPENEDTMAGSYGDEGSSA